MSPQERELLDEWCERLIPPAWREHALLRAVWGGERVSIRRELRPWTALYEQEMVCFTRLSTGEWRVRGFLGEFWTRPALAELLPLAEQVLALGWAPAWGEKPEPGAMLQRVWDSDWEICELRPERVRELQRAAGGRHAMSGACGCGDERLDLEAENRQLRRWLARVLESRAAWRCAAESLADFNVGGRDEDHDLRDAELCFDLEPAASKLGVRILKALDGRGAGA